MEGISHQSENFEMRYSEKKKHRYPEFRHLVRQGEKFQPHRFLHLYKAHRHPIARSKMSKSLSWDDLNYKIQPWIRTAIDTMGFETMTPVQASTIPMFSGNKDVVVESVTGSGKTVSFVIPILEKIIADEAHTAKLKKGHFYSLIISPTRELSSQIQTVIESFLNHYPEENCPISSQLLIGTNKSTVRDDVNSYMENRPQILVGTPGRILDFLNMPTVKSSSCGVVVLDEADKLLDAS